MIAVFVKPPVPGNVKTRLATDIGNNAACRLYSAMAGMIIENARATDMPLAIFFDGKDPQLLPESWTKPAKYVEPQQGSDLGKRMYIAFSTLFEKNAEKVLLVGSDIPEIDTKYLENAFNSLENSDMVISPAVDGGYCLIGFNRKTFTETVFDNIPWSTGVVFQLTMAAASAAGLSVTVLPVLMDIDTKEDLKKIDRKYLQIIYPERETT